MDVYLELFIHTEYCTVIQQTSKINFKFNKMIAVIITC